MYLFTFYGCAASLLHSTDCRVHGLGSCGPRLSCPLACEILVPGPGTDPVSPVLAGGCLTIGTSPLSL